MCELSPVQFHGDTIFCIDYHGEPFTPMKPIVENMGISWQGQQAKLSANRERWGIKNILIPTESGEQEMVAMPVRKLPAFLAGINPKKVRPELRPKIELYQNESDNALWDYWTKGRAERQAVHPAPQAAGPDDAVLQWLLAKEISRAAKEGRPFTRFSKVTGLHARRGEMALPLRFLGWRKFRKLFEELRERGLVTVGEYSRSGGRHLDARVPQRPKPALPPLAARPAPAPKALPGPAMPRVRVVAPSCNKELRAAADIAAAIRLVEDIRRRVQRDHRPGGCRIGDRRGQSRYEMQWDMFRACNASLGAAVAALCAAVEVGDWA